MSCSYPVQKIDNEKTNCRLRQKGNENRQYIKYAMQYVKKKSQSKIP